MKSIDSAIENCRDKIKEHKKQANYFLTTLILMIMIFTVLFALIFMKSDFESVKIDTLERSAINNLNSIKRNYETKDAIYKNQNKTNELINLINDTYETKNIDSLFKFIKSHDKVMTDFRKELLDINYKIDTSLTTTRNLAREIREENYPDNKIEINTFYYLIYGLFILIFGVVTSFYRYHLKEISKIEKYYFGFLRIRIAGNNSKTGYDDLVKSSLSYDAFSNPTTDKKVESPIPGHPTFEIYANIINRLLDKLELKTKK